jgi:CheY-like chemotaxis protein
MPRLDVHRAAARAGGRGDRDRRARRGGIGAAAGLAVTTVHDGRSALASALQSVPDAAILDIGMPGLNGYDLARALRANAATASLPLVAVSGWGQENDKQLAAEAGFDRHFVKPVRPDALLDALVLDALAALAAAVGRASPREGTAA